MKIYFSFLLSILAAVAAFGQEASKESPFTITPNGRVLFDGAFFAGEDHSEFKPGLGIPEVRLGAKLSYEKWTGIVSIGFARNKLALKDLYVMYNFSPNTFVKGGSFIHYWGLQSATSSSLKSTMEEPMSNSCFNNAWMIGLMGVHSAENWLGALSFHVEPQSIQYTPNELNHEGYGFLTRWVYRPAHETGKIAQVGLSAGVASPQGNYDGLPDGSFTFGANFPTRVDNVKAISATVDEAKSMLKLTPELLLSYDRFALESQYYFTRVWRKHSLHHYTAQGAYVNVRTRLLGKDFKYSMNDADIKQPERGNLDLVLGYNYTTLSDASAGIFGGRANSFSATLNYQVNRFMTARLNYTYTHRWDRASTPTLNFNVIQARFQFLF